MNRLQYVLAAVLVAGSLVSGCGGGGGSGGGTGGGGGPPPPPPPPITQRSPVFSSASASPTTVEGGKDTVTVTVSASDADNDPITITARQASGSAVGIQSQTQIDKSTLVVVMNAVSADTSASIELSISDGHTSPVFWPSPMTIMVTKPASSGGGGGTSPSAPQATGIDFHNRPAITGENSHMCEVTANTTGYTFSLITAKVDGVSATIGRNFGQTPGTFNLELPRLMSAGSKILTLEYPGAAPTTFSFTYSNIGDTWMIFDYSDGTPTGHGQALKIKIDSLGNASSPAVIIGANGHDNKGFAAGADRNSFWVAGQESSGAIQIFYCNAATNTVNTCLVTTGGTNPGDTSGSVQSIAALRDGSKAVIDWIDALNSKGQGANVHWLTVLQVNGSGVPSVIKEIPLAQVGKVASNATMTPIQTVELMIQQGTTIGGGLKQDWAVLGQQSPTFKLYLVPLESTGLEYLRYDLTVKPQVVECFEDMAQRVLSFLVVGQTGSGVSFQQMVTTHSIPAEPGGFGGTSKSISNATQDVAAAYFRNGSGVQLLLGLVLVNAPAYYYYDVTPATPQLLGSRSFSGVMNTRYTCPAPGNAWFAVVGKDGSGSEMHIVQPDFTTFRAVGSINQANTLRATENDVLLEVRSTDNVIIVGQTGSVPPQIKAEPASIPANAGVDLLKPATSRQR